MKILQWEPAPYRTNKRDCIADTPSGRYYIQLTRGRDKHYILKLNGQLIAREETLAKAQASAVAKEALNGMAPAEHK